MTKKCHEKQCARPVIVIPSQKRCCSPHRQKQQRVNRTVFVDQHFGDDFTGKRTYPGKPFRTIPAALLAAKDEDTIWVRASDLPTGTPPGPYIQDLTFPMPNLPTSIKFYLEPDAVLQANLVALFVVGGAFNLEVDGDGTLSGNGLPILVTDGTFTGQVLLKATTYLGVASVSGTAPPPAAPGSPAPVAQDKSVIKSKAQRKELRTALKNKILSKSKAPAQPSNSYLFTLTGLSGLVQIQGVNCFAGQEGVISSLNPQSVTQVYYDVLNTSSDELNATFLIGGSIEFYLTSDHLSSTNSFNVILVIDSPSLHLNVKNIENPAGNGISFGNGVDPVSATATGHVQKITAIGNGINVTNPTDGFDVDLEVDQITITNYNSGIALNNSLAVMSDNHFKYRGQEINLQQGGYGIFIAGPVNADFDVTKIVGNPGIYGYFAGIYAFGVAGLSPVATIRSNHLECSPPATSIQFSQGVAIETASSVVADVGTIIGFSDGFDVEDSIASGTIGSIVDCQIGVSLENANTVANGGLPITANVKVGTIRSSLDNIVACSPGPFFDVNNRIALFFDLIDLTGRGASTSVSNTFGIAIVEQAFVPVVQSNTVMNIQGNYLGAINPITTNSNFFTNITGLFPNEQINFDFELCDAVVPLGGVPQNTALIINTQSLIGSPPPNVSFRGKYRAGSNDVINTDIAVSLSNTVMVNTSTAGLFCVRGPSARGYGTPVATNAPQNPSIVTSIVSDINVI